MGQDQPNRGQEKVHQAQRKNPVTGEIEYRDFKQSEWRARDKSEGWERPDGEEDETEVPEG